MSIVINKSSKLYKLFDYLSNIPFFSIVIEKENNRINSFNDVCTFCRHLLYILMISGLFLIFGIVVLSAVILYPLLSLISLELNPSTIVTLSSIGLIIGIYLVLCVSQAIYQVYENRSLKENPPGIISKTISIVRQKHDNFCKQLTVKDD